METIHYNKLEEVKYNLGDQNAQPASYGLTHSELKELQHLQQNGEEPFIQSNGIDKNYKVPLVEADSIYHYRVEARRFDESTGEKLSRPKIVRLNIPTHKEWERRNFVGFEGMVVDLLHDPFKYNEEKKKAKTTNTKK